MKYNHGSLKEATLKVWQIKNWEMSNFQVKLAASKKMKKVSPLLLHISRSRRILVILLEKTYIFCV